MPAKVQELADSLMGDIDVLDLEGGLLRSTFAFSWRLARKQLPQPRFKRRLTGRRVKSLQNSIIRDACWG